MKVHGISRREYCPLMQLESILLPTLRTTNRRWNVSNEPGLGRRRAPLAAGTLVASAAAAAAVGAGFMSQASAGPRPTEWSAPVNMGAPINSEFSETSVKLTRQGRTLYFASSRPCGAD